MEVRTGSYQLLWILLRARANDHCSECLYSTENSRVRLKKAGNNNQHEQKNTPKLGDWNERKPQGGRCYVSLLVSCETHLQHRGCVPPKEGRRVTPPTVRWRVTGTYYSTTSKDLEEKTGVEDHASFLHPNQVWLSK